MLVANNEANIKLEQDQSLEEDLNIWSIDAEALYPSLNIKDILEGLWYFVKKSK